MNSILLNKQTTVYLSIYMLMDTERASKVWLL